MVSAETFEKLPHDSPRELIRGKIVECPYLGAEEGMILGNIGGLLHSWAKQTARNYCGVRVGHLLSQNPDTVRIADVSYIRAKQFQKQASPKDSGNLPLI
jgi:Uma2 family endonuclease